MFGNNASPFATPKNAPPFATPLIFITLGWKFRFFPLFWGWTQYSWNSRNRCHPFLPPLFSYLKSSRCVLQFFILSLCLKMHCFGCTNPSDKNELAYYAFKLNHRKSCFLIAKKLSWHSSKKYDFVQSNTNSNRSSWIFGNFQNEERSFSKQLDAE